MSTTKAWRLRRYGRLVPGSGGTGAAPWKIYEAHGSKPDIVLTIVESGYLLVLQGMESLDSIPLLCGSETLKVHQRSDNLMFRLTVKGEGRMMRMQFDGSTPAEAIKECSVVVEILRKYIPITRDDAMPALNQSPAGVCARVTQQTLQAAAKSAEPEVVQGSLSIKRLSQHFLGEVAVILPEMYRHSFVAQGELEPILRVCLLDPSFHAFVEKVEGELRKLLEE